jgi:hypothetical protein
VPSTTNILSSNPIHGEMYSKQDFVIKFVSDLWQFDGFHCIKLVWLVYGVQRHSQHYFSYIMGSVLLVEETGVPGENHQPATSHWQLYHVKLYRIHLTWTGLELITLVVIGTDCTGSCKSNYHTITTTTAPIKKYKYRNY